MRKQTAYTRTHSVSASRISSADYRQTHGKLSPPTRKKVKVGGDDFWGI